MASGHMDYGEELKDRKRRGAGSVIALPRPNQQGGVALAEALRRRHSTREFSTRDLSEEVLSNLLWAAFGVNRPDTGGRTAPSAHDWEEIDLYVAMAKGLYLYDAGRHALNPVAMQDLRAQTVGYPAN